MKCSSRRNCNLGDACDGAVYRPASMKCSSRRNCNSRIDPTHVHVRPASMKCSSRRNCNEGAEASVEIPVAEPQ